MVLKSPAAFEVNNHTVLARKLSIPLLYSVCVCTCIVLLNLVMLITSEVYLITLCKNVQSAHLYAFCQATKFDCVLILKDESCVQTSKPHYTFCMGFLGGQANLCAHFG